MARPEVQAELLSSAQGVIQDEVKTRLQHSLVGSVSPSEALEDESKAEAFEATDEAKKVLDLFGKCFKSPHLKKLGLSKIKFHQGKWYLPWDAGVFNADIEPDHELVDAKRTRPSYEDPIQQSLHELRTYLAHKHRRRHDKSVWAKPHKTLLAKLCHKCIERIELLPDRAQKREYYGLYKQFLAAIWEDKSLINQSARGDGAEEHLEDFIYAQKQICEQRDCYLAHEEPPAALATWAETLDQELAALHICGARAFHFLLQNKTIPDNLEKHLRTLGTTYHRLMLPDDQKLVAGERLRLVNRHRRHWDTIAQSAQEKLRRAGITAGSSFSSLMALVQGGTLTLEEALFNTVGEYYNADQCLYLALHHPQYLPLTESERIGLFGSSEFLQLYHTEPPMVGLQWLNWHIQQASTHLFPALHVLSHCDNEDDDQFHHHLKALVAQVRELRQAPAHCTVLTNIGALAELGKAVTYQHGIVGQFEQHLTQLQQHLHCLVLVRALLAQYRQLLPQTGELMGALALQTDLILIAQVVSETVNEMQQELTQLLPLQGMGFVGVVDGSQKLLVTKQSSLLDIVDGIRKPSKGLLIWRGHKAAREKSLDDLETRLSICHRHATEIHAKTAPKRVQHLVKKTKRQFQLARLMLSEGLSDHLSEKQHLGLKQGEGLMTRWLEVVDAGVAEHKQPAAATPVPTTPVILPQDRVVLVEEKKFPDGDAKLAQLPAPAASITIVPVPVAEPMLALARPVPAVATIENKAAALVQWTSGLTDRLCTLLQTQADVSQHWVPFLEREQEAFFSEFSKIRSHYSDEHWMHFFHTKLGVLFSPLPQTQKPTHFLWWYRHTLADRSLFFRLLTLSALMSRAKRPNGLTEQQQARFRLLLNAEQEAMQQEQQSQWSWLDPFRCQISSKLTVAQARLQQLIQEHDYCRYLNQLGPLFYLCPW